MVGSSDRRVQYSQNLLHNPVLVHSLVDRSDIGSGDVVLEIGPGRGIITETLAARASHVLAIEKDPVATAELQSRFLKNGNITVFCADFMDFPLPVTSYKVFSNIPYNVTAAIVGKLTSGLAPPDESWLVLQHEAAAKLMGLPRHTLTSICLWPRFELSIEHRFRRSDFRPAPGVDSVLIRIGKRTNSLIEPLEMVRFQDFATAMFTAWKPTVGDALMTLIPRWIVAELDKAFGTVLQSKPGDTPAHVWVDIFMHLQRLDRPEIWRKIDGSFVLLQVQQSGLQKQHRSRSSDRYRSGRHR